MPTKMEGSSNKLNVIAHVISTLKEDLKYIQASNVNVSNFVSVKLSSQSNYDIWKAQMLCLIDSQMLLHIIDAECSFPEDKGVHMICQYDKLVKGWIFGSMNEKVLKDFIDINSANEVWRKLESIFNPLISDIHDSLQVKFEIQVLSDTQETDDTIRRKRLCKAVAEGCWWKAKSILNVATEVIARNGNTMLHLAVEMGQDYFTEKLLEFLKDAKDIETINYKGRTALHIAAKVGNKYAAQLLVQKRKELLVMQDYDNDLPMDIAYKSMKLDMLAYLVKSMLSSGLINNPDDYAENAYEYAIFAAIYTKQYDLAQTLLGKNSQVARRNDKILMTIVITFPTDLGFVESLIYPSFNNKITLVRDCSLFQYNFLDKCVDDISRVVKICNNMCCSWLGKTSMIFVVPIVTLYPIYQLSYLLVVMLRRTFSILYFHLWKILAVTLHPFKNIELKRNEYIEAKRTLSLICDQIGVFNGCYKEAIFEAVRQDVYEVVDEILARSPHTINYKDEEGHNIIQLAVIYRSEKVYNLILHIIQGTECYRTMKDSSMNNLAHLAGRLAPSYVLSRTTGEALKIQQEHIWHEEVKKLMLPIELIQQNIYKETPAMVFATEHQELMKQGENWMKATAESCSITAALIVTIVFAAAITVPGGSNPSGIPVFRNEIAFTIFALFNALSLFAAATALLLFLSILTARFSEIDFLIWLPRRLIFGLLTLFLSTTAMIVAFGAILFLVFCDQRPWMLAPISGFAFLPISIFVTVKLPLLLDLIRSTYVPIFGKQSYLESCKTHRNNTIFVD